MIVRGDDRANHLLTHVPREARHKLQQEIRTIIGQHNYLGRSNNNQRGNKGQRQQKRALKKGRFSVFD